MPFAECIFVHLVDATINQGFMEGIWDQSNHNGIKESFHKFHLLTDKQLPFLFISCFE